MKTLAVVLFCLGVAACQTPAAYHAAAHDDATGYTELRIAPGRYRVTYAGGRATSAGKVEDDVMRRAAEISLRDGYDWFRVVDRSGESGSSERNPDKRIARSLEISCGKDPRPLGGDTYDAQGVLASLSSSQDPYPPTR